MAENKVTGKAARDQALKHYRFGKFPVFVIGSFDKGVTVYSQQVRALNLAWAMMDSRLIVEAPLDEAGLSFHADPPKRIAVIGGGFAGLTFVAGLLRREAAAEVTIFEQRDTLLPLQHGSDARWLHPRIYDWPAEGSDAGAAMLPVLNWTAGRASDVAVQVLAAWRDVVNDYAAGGKRERPRLFCNSRHVQIFEAPDGKAVKIEWVGEHRDPRDATASDGREAARGLTEQFDIVVLAVGFGLEKDETISYWRNDVRGQPSLDRPRRTFLISGQGDGAMIDLLRLRISQYRQDRILDEIFSDAPNLFAKVREIYHNHYVTDGSKLYDAFESLEQDMACQVEFRGALAKLTRRLRRDTDAILRIKLKRVSELFDPSKSRISFQNKVLVYLLYKCGGFTPSDQPDEEIIREHSISPPDIINRHGTFRNEQFERILSERLSRELSKRRGAADPDPLSQGDQPLWPGGYFAYGSAKTGDAAKGFWRKEYLPAPTALLGLSFCSAVSGVLIARHGETDRLRVTLHRSMTVGGHELLQQCCDYVGLKIEPQKESSAARTFPAENATIGAAYRTRRIVRSRQNVQPSALKSTMQALKLNDASREMSDDVGFVLAIPLLEPEAPGQFTAPSPVAGVVYVDSRRVGFYLDDDALRELVGMCQALLSQMADAALRLEGVSNVLSSPRGKAAPPPKPLDEHADATLEIVDAVDPPRTSQAFQFNFDHSDFVPVVRQEKTDG